MLNLINHARPRRPRANAHTVLALVTLAALTAAVLQPGDAAAPVAAATAATSTDHGSVPQGSAEVDSPRWSAAAREARTVDDKSERRRARLASVERQEQTSADGAAADEIDSVEEAQAALQLAGVGGGAGRHADEQRADAKQNEEEGRKKKERRERRRAEAKRQEAKRQEAKQKAAKAQKAQQQKARSAFPEGPSRLFARHDNVHLFTPSADPVRIGFHEAAYPVALGMIPLGRALANDNMGKYHLPPFTPTDQQYLVLSSRGRPHHATSAADIVMRPGEPVRSVVTGMVIEAEPYSLYGRYPDGMIRIRSAEDNGKIVTMLHITGLRVHVGQQVLAGETIVADTATSFPFLSQIDYYLGGRPHPHVHVEVKRG